MPLLDQEGNPLIPELLKQIDAYANSKTSTIRNLDLEEEFRSLLVVSLSSLEMQFKEFEDAVRYMAENAHQAYHEDMTCGWWACPRNICTAAQQALQGLVQKMKEPQG